VRLTVVRRATCSCIAMPRVRAIAEGRFWFSELDRSRGGALSAIRWRRHLGLVRIVPAAMGRLRSSRVWPPWAAFDAQGRIDFGLLGLGLSRSELGTPGNSSGEPQVTVTNRIGASGDSRSPLASCLLARFGSSLARVVGMA